LKIGWDFVATGKMRSMSVTGRTLRRTQPVRIHASYAHFGDLRYYYH